MSASVTVWAVELAKDVEPDEVQGTLELERAALVFTPKDERLAPLEIPFETVRKVRRLRGSPVLMVQREAPDGPRRTAFYFAQPPPLGVLLGETPVERPIGFGAFRSPRRKARRDNVGYLGIMNRQQKAIVAAWVRAVRARMHGPAGSPATGT